MKFKPLNLVIISTPIGYVGSGKGGGVELTLIALIKGLLGMGNKITLVAPTGSVLPPDCGDIEIHYVSGVDQPSWQHQDNCSPVLIPINSVLPKLLEKALDIGKGSDAIINLGYDWLPIWLTPRIDCKLFHLISMGAVSNALKDLIKDISNSNHNRLAFHTYSQASDYELSSTPIVVGNGFDLNKYKFQNRRGGAIGWAGRVAPEKGLEDAVSVAVSLEERIMVWGLIEDRDYAQKIESSFPSGVINWRGFLETTDFQKELGSCRVLINTPKWNEAYGNVVVEAMACGVPVVSYKRGGPAELINPGVTGWLAKPDDIEDLSFFVKKIEEIDRYACRDWVVKYASIEAFAQRIYTWLMEGILKNDINDK